MREEERGEEALMAEVTAVARRLLTHEGRLHAVDLLTSLNAVTPKVLTATLDIFLEVAEDTGMMFTKLPDRQETKLLNFGWNKSINKMEKKILTD